MFCTSTLERIAEAVVKALMSENSEATKNKPTYVYPAPLSERKIAGIISKIKGTEFRGTNLGIDALTKEAFEALKRGEKSKNMNFYIPFCYGEGYGGNFRYQAWNEKLGLREMTDVELEVNDQALAQSDGVSLHAAMVASCH